MLKFIKTILIKKLLLIFIFLFSNYP